MISHQNNEIERKPVINVATRPIASYLARMPHHRGWSLRSLRSRRSLSRLTQYQGERARLLDLDRQLTLGGLSELAHMPMV